MPGQPITFRQRITIILVICPGGCLHFHSDEEEIQGKVYVAEAAGEKGRAGVSITLVQILFFSYQPKGVNSPERSLCSDCTDDSLGYSE